MSYCDFGGEFIKHVTCCAENCSGQGELSETCSPEALINDPVTRMFWKNVKARSTNHASSPSTTILAIPADQIGEPV